MKALSLRRPGSILDIKICEISDHPAHAGEVVVRLEAAGLNPVDFKLALSGHPAWKYPHIPGLDGAGVIESVGQGVVDWKPGDRVVFHSDLRKDGCFAERIIVQAAALAKIPAKVSMVDAASLPCAALTAQRALLERSSVTAGHVVLVQGAAGGVGGFAIQIAKNAGARVIATCSTGNEDYVRGLGADDVVFYAEEIVRERVLELTDGQGVDVAIDPVGGHSATQTLACLNYGGHLVCLSGLPDLSKLPASTIAPSIHEIAIGAGYAFAQASYVKKLGEELQQIVDQFAAGKLRSFVSKTITSSEIPASLEELRERHVRGKIVADLREWPTIE